MTPIPPFKPGRGRPNVFSASDMNKLRDLANALAHPKIVRGEKDEVLLSDANITFQIRNETAGVNPTPGGPCNSPLTDALWTGSKIIACRGGILFEFDANGLSTGRTLVFAEDYIGDSYLAWDGTWLYATAWHDPSADDRFSTGKGLYKIDPAAFTITTFWKFCDPNNNNVWPYDPTTLNILSHSTSGIGMGLRGLCTAPGGKLFLFTMGYHDNPLIYRFIPATGLVEDDTNPQGLTYDFGALSVQTLIYDAALDRLWWSSDIGLNFMANALAGDIHTFGVNQNILQYFTWNNSPGAGQAQASGGVYGLELCPANNNTLYGVTRSPLIITIPSNVTPNQNSYNPTPTPDPSFGSFTLARSTAKPRSIKWVPYKSRLYIPTMQDNAVLELDPTGNTVTNTFTGFDIPYRIVDTGAKVFALQLGPTGGLKLVTI